MIHCLHRSKQSLLNLHVHVSLYSMPYQSFLFKMCRLNQLEEFHNSKDREIERLKVRCVLFHDLNELSIYRAHNLQGYEFASLIDHPSPRKLVFG